MGYHRAGWEVTGVDIAPQKNYPFRFVQDDAISFVTKYGWRFDAIAASPPCQPHSDLMHRNKNYDDWQDFLPQTRAALIATRKPYIIENVEGAPLIDPVMLCGTMFPELRVIRHRLFESNVKLVSPPHPGKHPLVFTHDKRKPHYGKLDQNTAYVMVTGGGNCSVANARDAMGIDWMLKKELNESIPPAFTEYLGKQLMEQL
jgi:DNA (cytosine-5)-methyltransferase 1